MKIICACIYLYVCVSFTFKQGDCQVVRIGNRSPEWWWLKDKEGKSPQKQNKGLPRTRVRTSGTTNSTPGQPGQPNLHTAGPGGGENIKRGAKGPGVCLSVCLSVSLLSLSLSLSLARSLFRAQARYHTPQLFASRLCISIPSHLKDVFSCDFLNKIEL